MIARKLLWLILACSLAPGVAAAQATAAAPAAATVPGELGRLFAPRELILEKTAVEFDKSFRDSLAGDANVARMERQFPGLLAAAGAAARRVLIGAMTTGIDDFQGKAAAVFAAALTPPEQQGVLAFMRTAVGRKLVAMGDEIYDTDKLMKDTGADGLPAKLTAQKLQGAIDYGFIGKLAPAEIREVAAFGATPAGRKFTVLTPRLQQLTAEWVNALLAAQQEPIQMAVATAMQAHVAKATKR